VPYWDIVTRSFTIAWKHKYLWLIALFSGEGGTSFSFSYSQSIKGNPATVASQVSTWVNDHAGLIAAIGLAWLLLVVAFFILAGVCEGATVRASAEHDAERPFGLGQAWTSGVHTVWVIVRFRLLVVALYLPLFVLTFGWIAGLLIAIVNGRAAAVLALALSAFVLVLVWIIYATYLFFLDRFGNRAVVLEELKAVAALRRAHGLLFKRLGRSLLVWLLSVAVGLVVGVILACFSALLVVPIVVAAVLSSSNGPAWPLVALGVIVLLPIFLVIAGFLAAQSSTYWTLAFRRMDVDYAPATYAYPAAPPAPQS